MVVTPVVENPSDLLGSRPRPIGISARGAAALARAAVKLASAMQSTFGECLSARIELAAAPGRLHRELPPRPRCEANRFECRDACRGCAWPPHGKARHRRLWARSRP